MKRKLFFLMFLLSIIMIIFCSCDSSNEDTTDGINDVCLHSFGEWEVSKQATCKEDGELIRICTDCSAKETMPVQKIDSHSPVTDPAVDATCEDSGLGEGSHCEVCNEILVPQTIIPALGHDPVIQEAVDATCMKDGLGEGSCCNICKKIIVEQAVIPKLEHTPIVDEAVPPTCKTDGLGEGSHCSVCNTVLVEQAAIPKTDDHTVVVDEAISATCTTKGLTEGSHCSVCDKVLIAQDIIPTNDSHTVIVDAQVSANCKDTGLSEGSHCSACGKILIAQVIIPVNDNHTPVTDPEKPSTCKKTGLTEGSHCSTCEKVLVEQTIIPISDNHKYESQKVGATPTSQGYYIYTCKLCGNVYEGGHFDYAGTDSLTYINNNDGTCLVSGISDANESEVNIPEKNPDGYTVVGVASNAFYSNRSIKTVVAPATVKTIGERAFSDCEALLTVHMSGVEIIEESAFNGANSLKSIVYSDYMTVVGEKAFYGCRNLKECRAVSSSNNLDTIVTFGYKAFAMSGITNPTFSADLTSVSLANSPFFACYSLGRVDLSAATLTSLGGGFSKTSFTEFIFPQGLTSISRSCFASCHFESMTIPDSVTEIKSNAFLGADFTKVTLGRGVVSIEMQAFEDSHGEIDLSKSVSIESVGYRAFAGSTVSSIILPASVRSIGEEAFGGCTNLKVLGIPFLSTSPESSNISTNCFAAIFSSNSSHDDIPSSLKTVIITAESVELERSDFPSDMKLSILVLPKDFTFETDALNLYLTSIYYHGTPEEFPDISNAIDHHKPMMIIYYYSESRPTDSGKFWHYVDGIPVAW